MYTYRRTHVGLIVSRTRRKSLVLPRSSARRKKPRSPYSWHTSQRVSNTRRALEGRKKKNAQDVLVVSTASGRCVLGFSRIFEAIFERRTRPTFSPCIPSPPPPPSSTWPYRRRYFSFRLTRVEKQRHNDASRRQVGLRLTTENETQALMSVVLVDAK